MLGEGWVRFESVISLCRIFKFWALYDDFLSQSEKSEIHIKMVKV
jgi:hypothetical protein